jgi:hypothetical protein
VFVEEKDRAPLRLGVLAEQAAEETVGATNAPGATIGAAPGNVEVQAAAGKVKVVEHIYQSGKKFNVIISWGGKRRFLGPFTDLEDAKVARDKLLAERAAERAQNADVQRQELPVLKRPSERLVAASKRARAAEAEETAEAVDAAVAEVSSKDLPPRAALGAPSGVGTGGCAANPALPAPQPQGGSRSLQPRASAHAEELAPDSCLGNGFGSAKGAGNVSAKRAVAREAMPSLAANEPAVPRDEKKLAVLKARHNAALAALELAEFECER